MDIKVLLGIPSTGLIRIETMVSIISIMNQNPRIEYGMACPMSSLIHSNRESILDQGVAGQFDYVFFIDSDMIFPMDTLNVLLNRNKDIIGVNYNFKSPPIRYVTQPIKEIPDSLTEPFRVKGLGSGLLLINVHILEKIKKPWFFFREKTEEHDWLGEDYWFCNQASAAGIDLWCDPTIKVGHIGTMVY